MAKESMKLVANNKKAYHDYFVDEKFEAGLVLHGTEVKSLRLGKCSIKESFIRIENGEVWVYGMHISPYEMGNIFNKDPLRPKKLLLHKYERLLEPILGVSAIVPPPFYTRIASISAVVSSRNSLVNA